MSKRSCTDLDPGTEPWSFSVDFLFLLPFFFLALDAGGGGLGTARGFELEGSIPKSFISSSDSFSEADDFDGGGGSFGVGMEAKSSSTEDLALVLVCFSVVTWLFSTVESFMTGRGFLLEASPILRN